MIGAVCDMANRAKKSEARVAQDKIVGAVCLDVASPARLVESDGIEHLIEFDAAQSDVSVTLKRIVGGKECSVPLLISIPKVCWRLNDESEWRVDIDEIWYEDARELYVKLPFRKASGIRLALVQYSVLGKAESLQ